MTSEPWCWPPDAVARLTVWQMLAYRDAQARRVERQTADTPQSPGGTPHPPPAAGPGWVPPREMMVRDYMTMGLTRADAEAQYDRQLRTARDAH